MENSIALKSYVQLCRCFLKSKIWKDKHAIKLYKKSSADADWQDYPILLLYRPVDKVSSLDLRKVNSLDFAKNIKFYAGQIWYAIDCRSDVNDDTSDMIVNIPCSLKDVMVQYFKIDASANIDKFLLRDLSGELWLKLGGDS